MHARGSIALSLSPSLRPRGQHHHEMERRVAGGELIKCLLLKSFMGTCTPDQAYNSVDTVLYILSDDF